MTKENYNPRRTGKKLNLEVKVGGVIALARAANMGLTIGTHEILPAISETLLEGRP